ncbi:MAG: PilZ domain-containing protein [Gammaproteobacteria bacterium]|nr:PilZ domain-containing protein [Gammaproteobacteria bacterium]
MLNAHNKRKASRYARQDRVMAQVMASIQPDDTAKKSWPAKTLDISKRGLRILGSDSLPIGAVVDLWVEIAGLKGKFYLSSEVRWSRVDDRLGPIMGVELREGLGSDIGHWQRLFDKKPTTKMQRKTNDAWGNAI